MSCGRGGVLKEGRGVRPNSRRKELTLLEVLISDLGEGDIYGAEKKVRDWRDRRGRKSWLKEDRDFARLGQGQDRNLNIQITLSREKGTI